MTHEQLLYKIITSGDTSLEAALRAVVELHVPVDSEYFENSVCRACSPDIDYYVDYPCKTIQAIMEEI